MADDLPSTEERPFSCISLSYCALFLFSGRHMHDTITHAKPTDTLIVRLEHSCERLRAAVGCCMTATLLGATVLTVT